MKALREYNDGRDSPRTSANVNFAHLALQLRRSGSGGYRSSARRIRKTFL
jgi:hypothetical protein